MVGLPFRLLLCFYAGLGALFLEAPVQPALSQQVATCELTGLDGDPDMYYVGVYSQFIFSDDFQVTSNVPVKLSFGRINTVSEPAAITRETTAIGNLRHLDLGIARMMDWFDKTNPSAAVDAQNVVGSTSNYRVLGYIRQLSAPGEYSYSVTVNCLM